VTHSRSMLATWTALAVVVVALAAVIVVSRPDAADPESTDQGGRQPTTNAGGPHLNGKDPRGGGPPDQGVPPISVPAGEHSLVSVLEEIEDAAPSDYRRASGWLRTQAKRIPGGPVALVEWFLATEDPLTDARGILVQELALNAVAGMEAGARSEFRAKVARAFERMGAPSTLKWGVGTTWLQRFKAQDSLSDYDAIEATAYELCEQDPENSASYLATAVALGADSSRIIGDLFQRIEAGLDHEKANGALPFDATSVIKAPLARLRGKVELVPPGLLNKLIASDSEVARYAGTALLVDANPRDPAPAATAMLEHPLPPYWYATMLRRLILAYGESSVEYLPRLLMREDPTLDLLGDVLSPDAAELKPEGLVERIMESRAGWDQEQKKVVLYDGG